MMFVLRIIWITTGIILFWTGVIMAIVSPNGFPGVLLVLVAFYLIGSWLEHNLRREEQVKVKWHIGMELEPRDVWIGLHWKNEHLGAVRIEGKLIYIASTLRIYVCLVPMVPIIVRRDVTPAMSSQDRASLRAVDLD